MMSAHKRYANRGGGSAWHHYSILIGTILTLALIFSYFIASNEQLLHQNSDLDNANKEWGFGQVRSHTFQSK